MRLSVTRVITAAAILSLTVACGSSDTTGSKPGAAQPPASPTANAGHTGHTSYTPPPTIPLRAGERFTTLSMARPYPPKAPTSGSTDDYRCFLVDPGLTANTFLLGSQFLPQNPDVVHHAIFFRVSPQNLAEAKQLDAAAPGDGWTCFGGTGIGGGGVRGGGSLLRNPGWVAAWAPGGKEALTQPGTGTLMEAGSQLVMQIHYNLLATGGATGATDQSSIRLRLAPGSANLQPLNTRLLVAPVELPCAPGETGRLCDRTMSVFDVARRFGERAGSTVAGLTFLCNDAKPVPPGSTQQCDHQVRETGVIRAAAGHMHLLGKSIKVELNPGTAAARTLLDVPVYDFDNQGSRPLAQPVAMKPGDKLRVTCTHDATLRQKLPALKGVEPRYVVWGEGTSDEMCLGVLVWSAK
jgi:hypothetical protein